MRRMWKRLRGGDCKRWLFFSYSAGQMRLSVLSRVFFFGLQPKIESVTLRTSRPFPFVISRSSDEFTLVGRLQCLFIRHVLSFHKGVSSQYVICQSAKVMPPPLSVKAPGIGRDRSSTIYHQKASCGVAHTLRHSPVEVRIRRVDVAVCFGILLITSASRRSNETPACSSRAERPFFERTYCIHTMRNCFA